MSFAFNVERKEYIFGGFVGNSSLCSSLDGRRSPNIKKGRIIKNVNNERVCHMK